ncbi:MAG: DNA-processing protein DprA [Tissierellia bacterium]|nr:DNA-processing protein DprA [Fermentimonas sp.]MDD4436573.1 DNA-processing protein DprA [Tissierellia bacterium]
MEYWIWLRQISGIGAITAKRLLERLKSPKAIYEACEEELLSVEGIGVVLAKVIREHRNLDQAKALLEEAVNYDIKLLTYHDTLYPIIAKEYSDAPILLYYKGQLRKNSSGVAIVGSRRCTEYGKKAAVEAAGFLAQNDIPVISGMAKGIDGYAHIGCLKAGGYTIAFLGNGVDICYPKEHEALMAGIIENGAVISQYPPKTKPRPKHFPERNALISSWSQKVLVVEAAEKSGALITAGFAKAQGREVYALPHEIYNPTGRGVNCLIEEGAHVYLNPSQLLLDRNLINDELIDVKDRVSASNANNSRSRMNLTDEPLGKIDRTLTNIEKQILDSLSFSPKTIEEISGDTKIDQIQLIEVLSLMELEGLINTCSGGRFVG